MPEIEGDYSEPGIWTQRMLCLVAFILPSHHGGMMMFCGYKFASGIPPESGGFRRAEFASAVLPHGRFILGEVRTLCSTFSFGGRRKKLDYERWVSRKCTQSGNCVCLFCCDCVMIFVTFQLPSASDCDSLQQLLSLGVEADSDQTTEPLLVSLDVLAKYLMVLDIKFRNSTTTNCFTSGYAVFFMNSQSLFKATKHSRSQQTSRRFCGEGITRTVFAEINAPGA